MAIERDAWMPREVVGGPGMSTYEGNLQNALENLLYRDRSRKSLKSTDLDVLSLFSGDEEAVIHGLKTFHMRHEDKTIIIAPSLVHPFEGIAGKVVTDKSPVPVRVIRDVRFDGRSLDVRIHAMSVQFHSTAPMLKEGKSRTYEIGPIQRTTASQFLLSWKDFSIALGILVVGSSGVSIIYNPSWTAWSQGTSHP